jgi:hypothetical protein
MSARLRARAMGLMRQLDTGGGYRQTIEAELRQRLKTEPGAPGAHGAPGAQGAGAPGAAGALGAAGAAVACSCGTLNDRDARFCKNCGNRLAA